MVAIGAFLVGGGVFLILFTPHRPNTSPPDNRRVESDSALPPSVRPVPSVVDGTRDDLPSPRPAPEVRELDPVPPSSRNQRLYHSWLRSEDLTILYAAERWIDGGCTDGTMALGDFSPGGWATGPKVQCRPDGWIAFDAGQLLDNPRFYPDHTYCLNFRNALGNWGQHGGEQRAPGMGEIGVKAAQGADVGINIGFRINRVGQRHELEFTGRGITACQS
ncbi:MAG TPA: hypothetical protein VEY30_13295 [Myxococcaceae bacterium]|nr:hypothetical protein [Myxococcaceae bacterium]